MSGWSSKGSNNNQQHNTKYKSFYILNYLLVWLFYFCFCSSFNYITFNLFSSFKMELQWWVSSVTFKFYKTLTFDLSFSCLFRFFFFLFRDEGDIKSEQKYIFTLICNICGLWKPNCANLRWAKWHFSNHGYAKWIWTKPQVNLL